MKQLVSENWDSILEMLKNDFEIKPVIFTTFIKPLKVYDEDDNNVTILLDDDVYQHNDSYIKGKYHTFIKNSIEAVTGKSYNLKFISKEELDSYNNEKSENNQLRERAASANLNPNYTFDTFVVGDNNRLVTAAAISVAENPGTNWNPLFIYGGVGLGKTHLMHSIAHYILENQADARVLYVTSEQFTNEVIEAIKEGVLASKEFRKKYRNIDALLIDDIQFIGGKDAIQEELFHTFNALYEQKKQIILSSDKPPMELKNLEERLRSRFAWGVAVEIFSPDFETRMAILRSKEERDGKNIDNEVIQFIATNIKSNIRMLEGALNKLYAMSRLNKNQEINIDLAKSVLKDMITPDAPAKITSEYIASVVAEHFKITVSELKAKGRKEPVATARHITVYLCRKMTNDTQTKIGQFLGDRDHSTIVNSEDVITRRIVSDNELNQTIETIKKKISPQ